MEHLCQKTNFFRDKQAPYVSISRNFPIFTEIIRTIAKITEKCLERILQTPENDGISTPKLSFPKMRPCQIDFYKKKKIPVFSLKLFDSITFE